MIVRELMRQFDKKELLEIAETLDINVSYETPSKKIIVVIIKDLDENGVPAEEDCSPKLEDFLVLAGFIDEDDELDVDEDAVVKETVEIVGESRSQCFSFHSDCDPACRKCKISEACEAKRLKILPDCYGKEFDQKSEECKVCIENISCRILVE